MTTTDRLPWQIADRRRAVGLREWPYGSASTRIPRYGCWTGWRRTACARPRHAGGACTGCAGGAARTRPTTTATLIRRALVRSTPPERLSARLAGPPPSTFLQPCHPEPDGRRWTGRMPTAWRPGSPTPTTSCPSPWSTPSTSIEGSGPAAVSSRRHPGQGGPVITENTTATKAEAPTLPAARLGPEP